jgi:hypothetical protein
MKNEEIVMTIKQRRLSERQARWGNRRRVGLCAERNQAGTEARPTLLSYNKKLITVPWKLLPHQVSGVGCQASGGWFLVPVYCSKTQDCLILCQRQETSDDDPDT